MQLAVTGANGFLGSKIQEHLVSLGHEVVPFTRRNEMASVNWRMYSLQMPASKIDLTDIEAVVHCAYDMTAVGANHLAVNGSGAAELAAACRRSGTNLINISSVIAARPKVSWYARAKHASEVSVRGVHGTNIRLGLLTNFDDDLFANKVRRLIENRAIPCLPVPKGWVWQSNLESLLTSVSESVNRPHERDIVWLGGQKPVSLKNHIMEICSYVNSNKRLVEAPLISAKMLLWPFEKFSSSRTTFSIDALCGMSGIMATVDPSEFV
jgi:uncharacterized protein YbjT (DUF2867 family)